MTVNKKKAAEAAVLHHDLRTLCSSTPVEQHNRFILVYCVLFSSWVLHLLRNLLTRRWNRDVNCGLNNVFALQAWEGACIRPRVVLGVWFVNQKRSISQKKQVLVQLSLTLPQVKGVSGFSVVSQNDCGLTGRGEGPGEGEILETVRGSAWDGQWMTLFLHYIIWKITYTHILAFICQ